MKVWTTIGKFSVYLAFNILVYLLCQWFFSESFFGGAYYGIVMVIVAKMIFGGETKEVLGDE